MSGLVPRMLNSAAEEGRIVSISAVLDDKNTNHPLYHIIREHVTSKLPHYIGVFKQNTDALVYRLNDYVEDISDLPSAIKIGEDLPAKEVMYLPITQELLLEVVISRFNKLEIAIQKLIFQDGVRFSHIEEVIALLNSLNVGKEIEEVEGI